MNYTIKSSYLIVGSVSTGKSALAHYLLETYGGKYQLTPTVVVLPKNKQVYAHFLEVEKPRLSPLDRVKQMSYLFNHLLLGGFKCHLTRDEKFITFL